jgi:hypothetical protein
MSETDITPQEGTNPEPEVVEDTVAEETNETPAQEETETVVADTVPKSQFNQVLARAKKAEAELKRTKSAPTKTADTTSAPLSEDVVDSRILKSQGMADELLSELKTIAKLRGKTMMECTEDPIFLAIKEAAKKVKLPASRGSAPVKKAKDFTSKGLTPEEHKALWRESQGR